MVALPATFAKYSDGGPVGIQTYQSMFVTDSTRVGMFNARSSCVRMLNYIFSQNPISTDRPEAVASISVETPIDPYMAWRRAAGTSHIEVLPPFTEWDFQVFTPQERDRLLLDPIIISNLMIGQTFRVLVNGLGNEDQPQWTVWTAALSNAPDGTTQDDVLNDPSIVYVLTPSYDFEVASFADRDLLTQDTPPISIGQRVLVDGNPSTNGFWTVWEYVGLDSSNPEANATGFVLTRYQTYRTADFWSFVDYYAAGYSAADPPIVVYATISARDAAENPPKSSIVKINNDGTGAWIWTAFVDGQWSMVARQNGTIAFSSNLYANPSAPTIGLQPILASDLNNIASRDGSWEFRVLFDLLQDANLLMPVEVNELFFSMLHFIHAQQDQVAWAFKTSFMNIGGYNEQLTQTAVTPIDNVTNLTEYIEEIAPYRVKIRNFTQIVTPILDNAITHASDFDFPLYYDTSINQYRILDINSSTDLEIVQTTAPWSDWYSTYLNPEFNPSGYADSTWNGVRHFTITMNFDRVDHMPVLATQYFTYNPAVPNPLAFSVDLPNTPVTDLSEQIVQVFINYVQLDGDAFTTSSDFVQLLTAPNPGDTINVVVRASLSAGLAAARIQQFYDPTTVDDPENNLRTLMGLYQKGDTNDGGSLANNTVADYEVDGNYSGAATDESINPNDRPFGLADPTYEADRPEELIVLGSGESLQLLSYDANNTASVMLISSARPGTDLMAPEEVGDFDAAPLDTIIYDKGFAQVTLVDNANVQHGGFVIRSDAWQVTNWSNAGGVLASDLFANANTITITTNGSGMPFTIPVVEIINDEADDDRQVTTAPGIVWINSERVEFFQYSVVGNAVTLSQIRRGTHNTRIGTEQRNVATFTGDGVTTNFTLTNDTMDGVLVYVNDVLRNASGGVINTDDYTGFTVNIMKQINTDYTISNVANNVVVNFNIAPPLNMPIFIAKTDSLKHPQGTSVFDGAWAFYTPTP